MFTEMAGPSVVAIFCLVGVYAIYGQHKHGVRDLSSAGQQPNPSARQVPDIDGMVRRGLKYGVAATSAGEPSDQDYICPACGSEDNPSHFDGRCPACGHEPE